MSQEQKAKETLLQKLKNWNQKKKSTTIPALKYLQSQNWAKAPKNVDRNNEVNNEGKHNSVDNDNMDNDNMDNDNMTDQSNNIQIKTSLKINDQILQLLLTSYLNINKLNKQYLKVPITKPKVNCSIKAAEYHKWHKHLLLPKVFLSVLNKYNEWFIGKEEITTPMLEKTSSIVATLIYTQHIHWKMIV